MGAMQHLNLNLDLKRELSKIRLAAFEELATTFEASEVTMTFTSKQVARLIRGYARRYPAIPPSPAKDGS